MIRTGLTFLQKKHKVGGLLTDGGSLLRQCDSSNISKLLKLAINIVHVYIIELVFISLLVSICLCLQT